MNKEKASEDSVEWTDRVNSDMSIGKEPEEEENDEQPSDNIEF